MVVWLFGYLVSYLVGWLVGWIFGYLVGWLIDWFFGYLGGPKMVAVEWSTAIGREEGRDERITRNGVTKFCVSIRPYTTSRARKHLHTSELTWGSGQGMGAWGGLQKKETHTYIKIVQHKTKGRKNGET